MPTDVAPLVIDEYTAVVNIPQDAEVLTETALSNMIVAALNRIEHIRQNTVELATLIPRVVNIAEEFMVAEWNNVDDVLHADRNWRTASTGTGITIGTTDGLLGGGVGGLSVSLTNSGSAFAVCAGAAQTGTVIPADKIDRFACLASIPIQLANQTVMIGLAQNMKDPSDGTEVGTSGLVFYAEPGSANWRIRSKISGFNTTYDTGVPVVADDIFLFEFVRTGNTWSCRINESEVRSLTSPADNVLDAEEINFGVHCSIDATTGNKYFNVVYLGLRTIQLGNRYA